MELLLTIIENSKNLLALKNSNGHAK